MIKEIKRQVETVGVTDATVIRNRERNTLGVMFKNPRVRLVVNLNEEMKPKQYQINGDVVSDKKVISQLDSLYDWGALI